jgi:hypothetical protein
VILYEYISQFDTNYIVFRNVETCKIYISGKKKILKENKESDGICHLFKRNPQNQLINYLSNYSSLISLPSLKFFSDFVSCEECECLPSIDLWTYQPGPQTLGPVTSFDTSMVLLLGARLIFGWYDEASMKNMVLKLI